MAQNQQYGVIFDMDGVLIDSYDEHRISWQRMARERGLEMTDEQFKATFGRPSRDIIRQVWNLTDPAEVRQMDDRKEQIFRELLGAHVPAMPGAKALIEDLAANGFKLGVGSSGPPQNVRLVVERLGIREKLSGLTTATDVTRGKPDPQVFLLTAEKMGIHPSRCAVVEDAVHGITAAKRAGMKAIGLTGTASREALAEADLVVDRLSELNAGRILQLINSGARL